jgi:hypothetical protein
MSEAPRDPLAFDFGVGFEPASARIKGERAAREALVRRELPFHVSFLDDCLRSLLPNDLILLGAETGAGKTELARIIASRSAEAGRHVNYFALEAENLEIERRDKYAILCELVFERKSHRIGEMNYPDWFRGRCNDVIAGLDDLADEIVSERRSTLHTYYRGSKFDHRDIKRLFMAIQSTTDLIILDHLHYVDIEDENENRGFKTTIKMIRDVALGIGKPVILIAHLRKSDSRGKSLVPRLEDFHGSSDIIKVVTHSIMLAPARSMPSHKPGISNTFMYVPKDRHGGNTGLLALCEFDWRKKIYAEHYTLGRANGDQFEPIGTKEAPRWAKRHEPMSSPAIPDVAVQEGWRRP